MTAHDTDDAACPVKWCDELGQHAVHRHYELSTPVRGGAWVIGINITQPANHYEPAAVELTVLTRRGGSATISLEPAEAIPIGGALVTASHRAARR